MDFKLDLSTYSFIIFLILLILCIMYDSFESGDINNDNNNGNIDKNKKIVISVQVLFIILLIVDKKYIKLLPNTISTILLFFSLIIFCMSLYKYFNLSFLSKKKEGLENNDSNDGNSNDSINDYKEPPGLNNDPLVLAKINTANISVLKKQVDNLLVIKKQVNDSEDKIKKNTEAILALTNHMTDTKQQTGIDNSKVPNPIPTIDTTSLK
jgi:hypothetical protein